MRLLLLVSVALLISPSSTRADVAPPGNYVESCTLEEMEREGATCQECQTWHSDEQPCESREELEGLTQCCRSAGASSWTEVWCDSTCPTQRDLSGSGLSCQITPASHANVVPLWVLAMGGLFTMRRRRLRAND